VAGSDYTLRVHDGVAYIASPMDESLRATLRAIPGRFWDKGLRMWTIRLGPDRAESVARLVASFPAFRAETETLSQLDRYRALRDLSHPGIESVLPRDQWCLSLCADWNHPIVDELGQRPGALPYRAVGRICVPISTATAEDLRAIVDRYGIRLHAKARERLASPLELIPAARPEWRGWVATTAIDGEAWFVFATRYGRAPRELTDHPSCRERPGVLLVPIRGDTRDLVQSVLAKHRAIRADPRARRCLEELTDAAPDDVPPPALVTLDVSDDGLPQFRIEPLWSNHAVDAVTAMRSSDGFGRSDGVRSTSLPADAATAPDVQGLMSKHGIEANDAARRLLDELVAEHARGRELVALSTAHDAAFDAPSSIQGELMPFQRAGVAYAVKQRRVFIADEQGLGKTVQALCAIEADGAYPAIVVCPASLKLNWLRELVRWLPSRRTVMISGRKGEALEADFYVVNYDVLEARQSFLADLEARALVLDESHYCKNASAQRTKAAASLSQRLGPGALRLALTGTPLVNRPRELVPQLRILGRLEDFGSGAAFEKRFAAPLSRERLHWHLRSRCYVRRRKDEVLTQLPPKRRIAVPVGLTNEAEYRRLEEDLIAWLREAVADSRRLAERIDSALRAEALVKLNALRHVAARGKLHAAIEWIRAFVESGERLVIFAHHRDIQSELVSAFPDAARVVGSETLEERNENVLRFQEGDGPPLCICSLDAASHGLTLTAAANVAFLELGWTPAKHDQAEDRVHRIGQDRRVTAWYLLAADTIDERIAGLIDHKRAIVGSITDGRAGSEHAVVDRLLNDLAASSAAQHAA
jgi:SWI/SNF-related matrix-associated actin-dependent regulator 1 of chromatin subfamily A